MTRPGGTVARWGLALSVLFVLYQTFLPFRFDFSAAGLAVGLERASWTPLGPAGRVPLSRADLLGNVLLMMPLGFFTAIALARRRGSPRGGLPSPAAALAAGLLLSLAVEALQLFSPVRYPQVTDVLANAAGAGLGGLLARAGGARWLAHGVERTERLLRDDPLAVAWAAMSALVLLGALLPLDFGISRRALATQLARAHWDPFSLPPRPTHLAAVLGLVKQGWLLLFWGAAAAAHLGSRTRPLLRVLAWAALLVAVAEAGQIVVVSREVTAAEPLVGWLGAAAGAALVLEGRRRGLGRRRLGLVLGFGYLVYLVADTLAPLASTVLAGVREGRWPAEPAGWILLPWIGEADLPRTVILGEWAGRALRFLPLGAWLRLGEPRPGRRLALALAAGLIVSSLEGAVGRFGPRAADAAGVLMAWAGIAAGWALAARLRLREPLPQAKETS